MKRYWWTALVLVAMLCGCFLESEAELLDLDDEQLSYSIKQFFQAKDIGNAEGKQFGAKLLACTKVKYSPDGDAPTTFYRYQLVISPRVNIPMDKISVKVFPTNGVSDYVEWITNRGDRPTDPKQGFILEYPPMGITDKFDLQAFEYNFYLSNFGDDAMQDYGLSEEEHDKGMTQLRIEVYCDGKTEVLDLYCLAEVPTVLKDNDPLAQADGMVMDLVKRGTSIPSFSVYRP